MKRDNFLQGDRNVPGSKLKIHSQNVQVCQEEVDRYCDEKNAEAPDYNVVNYNCQEFVNDLLIELSLSGEFSFAKLFKSTLNSSSQLCLSAISLGVSRAVFRFLSTTGVKEAIVGVIKEAEIEIISQAGNEIVESLLRETVRGAFSWWQLFQILAEIIFRFLGYHFFEKIVGYTKDQSWALSYCVAKAASLGTAVLVGGLVAGPFGMAGGVLFWLCAEIVTCIFRAVSYVLIKCRASNFFPV